MVDSTTDNSGSRPSRSRSTDDTMAELDASAASSLQALDARIEELLRRRAVLNANQHRPNVAGAGLRRPQQAANQSEPNGERDILTEAFGPSRTGNVSSIRPPESRRANTAANDQAPEFSYGLRQDTPQTSEAPKKGFWAKHKHKALAFGAGAATGLSIKAILLSATALTPVVLVGAVAGLGASLVTKGMSNYFNATGSKTDRFKQSLKQTFTKKNMAGGLLLGGAGAGLGYWVAPYIGPLAQSTIDSIKSIDVSTYVDEAAASASAFMDKISSTDWLLLAEKWTGGFGSSFKIGDVVPAEVAGETLPAAGPTETPAPATPVEGSTSATPAAPSDTVSTEAHTIAEGENLWLIANKFLEANNINISVDATQGMVARIAEINGIPEGQFNLIEKGACLKLPAVDASVKGTYDWYKIDEALKNGLSKNPADYFNNQACDATPVAQASNASPVAPAESEAPLPDVAASPVAPSVPTPTIPETGSTAAEIGSAVRDRVVSLVPTIPAVPAETAATGSVHVNPPIPSDAPRVNIPQVTPDGNVQVAPPTTPEDVRVNPPMSSGELNNVRVNPPQMTPSDVPRVNVATPEGVRVNPPTANAWLPTLNAA